MPAFRTRCFSCADSTTLQSLELSPSRASCSTSFPWSAAGSYELVGEIRRYFEVALRYDPGNQKAQAYLDLVDNYRSTEARKRVQEAGELLKKGERSREQDYALCVAVTRAKQLAPQDEEVVSLVSRTAEMRGTLTSFYLQSGREAHGQAVAAPSPTLREQKYLDAFRSFNRALAVDPQNRGAQSEEKTQLFLRSRKSQPVAWTPPRS